MGIAPNISGILQRQGGGGGGAAPTYTAVDAVPTGTGTPGTLKVEKTPFPTGNKWQANGAGVWIDKADGLFEACPWPDGTAIPWHNGDPSAPPALPAGVAGDLAIVSNSPDVWFRLAQYKAAGTWAWVGAAMDTHPA